MKLDKCFADAFFADASLARARTLEIGEVECGDFRRSRADRDNCEVFFGADAADDSRDGRKWEIIAADLGPFKNGLLYQSDVGFSPSDY